MQHFEFRADNSPSSEGHPRYLFCRRFKICRGAELGAYRTTLFSLEQKIGVAIQNLLVRKIRIMSKLSKKEEKETEILSKKDNAKNRL